LPREHASRSVITTSTVRRIVFRLWMTGSVPVVRSRAIIRTDRTISDVIEERRR